MEMNQLQNEVEVLNLIGYKTALQFRFSSENIIHYQTIVPVNEFNYYNISFFLSDDNDKTFFNFDSFEGFLLEYQIHEVQLLDIDKKVIGDIYFSEYDKDYNK